MMRGPKESNVPVCPKDAVRREMRIKRWQSDEGSFMLPQLNLKV